MVSHFPIRSVRREPQDGCPIVFQVTSSKFLRASASAGQDQMTLSHDAAPRCSTAPKVDLRSAVCADYWKANQHPVHWKSTLFFRGSPPQECPHASRPPPEFPC